YRHVMAGGPAVRLRSHGDSTSTQRATGQFRRGHWARFDTMSGREYQVRFPRRWRLDGSQNDNFDAARKPDDDAVPEIGNCIPGCLDAVDDALHPREPPGPLVWLQAIVPDPTGHLDPVHLGLDRPEPELA